MRIQFTIPETKATYPVTVAFVIGAKGINYGVLFSLVVCNPVQGFLINFPGEVLAWRTDDYINKYAPASPDEEMFNDADKFK